MLHQNLSAHRDPSAPLSKTPLDPPARRALVDLARPLAVAEDALARLDERLATSPIAAAFCARSHFHDAAAAVFLEGELVHLEDLVLHDAAADVRTPTHALIRAHAALRTRRRLAAATPGFALTAAGLDVLRSITPSAPVPGAADALAHKDAIAQDAIAQDAIADEEDAFAAELADIDALIARSAKVLAGKRDPAPAAEPAEAPPAPDDLPALSGDDGLAKPLAASLASWHAALAQTQHAPPVAAAALAGLSFDALAPFPNQAWLGRLVVADLLRARNKTRHHLAALNFGRKLATRERRYANTDEGRLALWIGAITHAAEAGLRDHDRWLTARHLLERKLGRRRSTSRLPALVELVMRSPVVSANTIAAALAITPRAAQNLVAELGLRELTGRSRYRCWGVL